MKHGRSKVAIAAAMLGLALAGSSSAHAGRQILSLRTPSLVPDPDGYLYCTVVATSGTPIDIVATIVAVDGTNVTEFGSGFRASPAATGDGRYHAEETAGSLADTARSCTAKISGARRKDVGVSLTAFDAAGRPVATVEAR